MIPGTHYQGFSVVWVVVVFTSCRVVVPHLKASPMRLETLPTAGRHITRIYVYKKHKGPFSLSPEMNQSWRIVSILSPLCGQSGGIPKLQVDYKKHHQPIRMRFAQCQKVGIRLAFFYRVFTFENAIKKRNRVMFLKSPKSNGKLAAIPEGCNLGSLTTAGGNSVPYGTGESSCCLWCY
ncbi:hypothetical protein C8N47_106119 [Mangrovibacterium marinum]|uniref:Uncharacterized protein n=1 Tax=Mangrovibacterium marinum TaxID=1639118 RepID=A0A2T5C2P2_9BACT|nr:hypothetical protein C8N47_106119 [Mangrovibacterium marinum]